MHRMKRHCVFTAYTGPGGGEASMLESASLALRGMGGLQIARRRRASRSELT